MNVMFGTKKIYAVAMNRLEYNNYRGWDLPSDENGDDTGYLVEYVDGGPSNHIGHKGYISWSPSDVFHNAYQPDGSLSFGHALVAMESGHKVARAGWNGKGMWVEVLYKHTNDYGQVINPSFRISQVDGSLSSWVPSCGDCFANDWQIVV